MQKKPYKEGTMVRLNPDHGESSLFGTVHIGAREGWLWVVEDIERHTTHHGFIYTCKSLATGETRGLFEVEMVDATQDSSAG